MYIYMYIYIYIYIIYIYIYTYIHIIYVCIYRTKIGDLELVKRQVRQGIFEVVNSTDLLDVKYTSKLDDVILEFSSTRLLQTSWF